LISRIPQTMRRRQPQGRLHRDAQGRGDGQRVLAGLGAPPAARPVAGRMLNIKCIGVSVMVGGVGGGLREWQRPQSGNFHYREVVARVFWRQMASSYAFVSPLLAWRLAWLLAFGLASCGFSSGFPCGLSCGFSYHFSCGFSCGFTCGFMWLVLWLHVASPVASHVASPAASDVASHVPCLLAARRFCSAWSVPHHAMPCLSA